MDAFLFFVFFFLSPRGESNAVAAEHTAHHPIGRIEKGDDRKHRLFLSYYYKKRRRRPFVPSSSFSVGKRAFLGLRLSICHTNVGRFVPYT